MVPSSCYLIYLAYGASELCAEAVYSLLSYYQVAPAAQAVRVLIYTDSPAYFTQLFGARPDITYPAVTPAQWQAWRGTSNKVYLLKIGVLAHAAQHYPGNLLFVDTDTIWQADPAPLFVQIAQGQRIMHVSEGRLATGSILSRKVYQHLKKHVFTVGGHQLRLTPDTLLYNSGVLGFASPVAAQLPEVMALADQLYAAYNKHMMEQLAFSLRFAVDGPIGEAAPYVLHYWNLKAARPLLAQVFVKYSGQPLAELYERATSLQISALHEAEMAYRQLPGWRRTLLKLLGRQWRMPSIHA